MPSVDLDSAGVGRSERAFREAFERLKGKCSRILPKGTLVSQNNVAKEAGKDPSALRKARFPALVLEIQGYVSKRDAIQSTRMDKLRAAHRTIALLKKERDEALALRDKALSLLMSAELVILELKDTASSSLPQSNIRIISSRRGS